MKRRKFPPANMEPLTVRFRTETFNYGQEIGMLAEFEREGSRQRLVVRKIIPNDWEISEAELGFMRRELLERYVRDGQSRWESLEEQNDRPELTPWSRDA